jgi:hypothetical protein
MPTEWTPGKVVNPEVDMPFTEAGAWHFVAHLLDTGHPIQQVSLHQSHSEVAFVMLVDLKPGAPNAKRSVYSANARFVANHVLCS